MILRCASKSLAACAAMPLVSALAVAQDRTSPEAANPTPGCKASAAEVEANKKADKDFSRTTGEARVALLDRAYTQHIPVFVQRAQQEKLSDYEEAQKTFLAQANAPVLGLGLGPTPAGNRFEIETAECDIVTVVHSGFRHDPTGQSKF